MHGAISHASRRRSFTWPSTVLGDRRPENEANKVVILAKVLSLQLHDYNLTMRIVVLEKIHAVGADS